MNEKCKDVLIIFNDLSKHAVSCRTIPLLLKRPPGREANPMIYSIYIHVYLNALADLIKKGVNTINNSFSKANNLTLCDNDNYYKNNELQINEEKILENIKTIQDENNLQRDSELIKTKSDSKKILTFDIEMETGTGKTYVYINSIYELNKLYG